MHLNALKMNIDTFDYHLPEQLIAQHPAEPRESARLMVVHRDTQSLEHKHVHNLPDYLQAGDVLVINSTKVFKARLKGLIAQTSTEAEVFLIRPQGNGWLALVKPGKKCPVNTRIIMSAEFSGTITARHADGSATICFQLPTADVISLANKYGHIPLPPYIKSIPQPDEYQTVYAKNTGSVAAPTAGFHLSKTLLETIRQKGITITDITLHVGLGTFQPIRHEDILKHHMHPEWVEITPDTAEIISLAKKENRRVVAIGTTTVRALEGVAATANGLVVPYSGDVNMYITPGFTFRVVDVLLTNFHLPKSTLIVLVSALAGIDIIKQAYAEAVLQKYRFYSFGDAMLIL